MTYMERLNDEDHNLFAAAIERVAEQYHSIDRCRSGDLICEASQWKAFAEQGVFGLGISPEHGGVGGGITDLAIVTRQIGQKLLVLPYMDTVVIGAFLITSLGSDEQKHRLLPLIANGELRLGFAHREPGSGNRLDRVETRVSDRKLTGEKIEVMDGVMASQLIVSARDEQGRLSLHLVDREQRGISFQHYRLIDNRMASKVLLNDVKAEPLNMDGAADAISVVLDRAAACLAAETVGVLAGANRDTLEFAKVRHQFGRPIGSFQVLQHRMVDMFIAEQSASALVIDALSALDGGARDAPAKASAAKAWADRAGRSVCESAIQIHGGMGMTDECSAGHYLKRVLANGSQFGTASWHVAQLAQRQA